MAQPQTWQSIYVERPAELTALQDAWVRAARGEPVIAALVAESGFGKTRLAQTFYAWLSADIDRPEPEGYWPAELGVDGSNLRYNPRSRTTDVSPVRGLPFLWWGMRCARPSGERNMHFGSALSEGKFILGEHLLHYQRIEALERIERERGAAARKLALDLGLEAAGSLLSFGLLGILKSVGEFRRENTAFDEAARAIARGEMQPPSGNTVHTILADLRRVCHSPPAGTPRVPLVLLIDDAQWLHQDDQLHYLLTELVSISLAEKWPVLILMTCWEREWQGEDGLGVRHMLRSWGTQPIEIALSKLDLAAVAEAALPGLSPTQINAVLEKADGNAEFLRLSISALQGRLSHFVDHDLTQALSASGEAYLEQSDRQKIITDRVAQAPHEVQRLLALASLQGMRFSPAIVQRTGAALSLADPALWLTRADNPYAFIELAQAQAEFRQRAIWKVAADLLVDHFPDQQQVDGAYRQALAAMSGEAEPSVEDDEIIARDIVSANYDRHFAASLALTRICTRRYRESELFLAEQAAFAWLDHPLPNDSFGITGDVNILRTLFEPSVRRADWHRFVARQLDNFMRRHYPNGALIHIRDQDRLTAYFAIFVGSVSGTMDKALRDGLNAAAIVIARHLLARGKADASKRPELARGLRIALQRHGDALPPGPELDACLEEQVALLEISAPTLPPFQQVSDWVNTHGRVVSAHINAGRIEAARDLRARCVDAWRAYVAKRPEAEALSNFAREISNQCKVLRQIHKDADVAALAKEGLDAAERAFHLAPFTQNLLPTMHQLITFIGPSVAKDTSFRAFTRRANALLEEKLAATQAGHLAAAERSALVGLGLIIILVLKWSRDRQAVVQMCRNVIKIIEHEPDHMQRTRPVVDKARLHMEQARLMFRQGRFTEAWRHFRAAQRLVARANEIFDAHGLEEEFDWSVIRGRKPVRDVRMPDSAQS